MNTPNPIQHPEVLAPSPSETHGQTLAYWAGRIGEYQRADYETSRPDYEPLLRPLRGDEPLTQAAVDEAMGWANGLDVMGHSAAQVFDDLAEDLRTILSERVVKA